MAQELTQTQEQEQKLEQRQRIKAQQVMVVRMLEMPLAQMEQNIQAELDDNPALEGGKADDDNSDTVQQDDGEDFGEEQKSFDEERQTEEMKTELDKVLDSIDKDDRLPTANYDRANNSDPDADQEEQVYGNTESFYDNLHNQIREHIISDRQQIIMEYLIGSLDNDGLLRKDIESISDEIAIKEYIDVSKEEIEKCITILQSLDPAGIGARSLQECLLIQIFRKKPTHITKLMYEVVNNYYKEFIHREWRKIAAKMKVSEDTAEEVFEEIRKLNPRPGAALGETMGRNTQQVTPDFIIEVDEYDNISFTLCRGKIPELYVSPDFQNMIEGYHNNPKSMTRKDKEALLYMHQKVGKAQMFIDAVQQRQKTMRDTMAAIVALQHDYLISGDEVDLKPMILEDVAKRAGVDISTVSRVCNSKYAQTPWGIIPLSAFFTDGYDIGNGEIVSTKVIKNALRELVDNEDKSKPMSDERLATEMKKRGFPIARRTVAKYREQLAIPTSSLRKN